jgi:hypothetical protein
MKIQQLWGVVKEAQAAVLVEDGMVVVLCKVEGVC